MVSPGDMEVNFNYVKNTSLDIKSYSKKIGTLISSLNWKMSDIRNGWVSSNSEIFLDRYFSLNDTYAEKITNIYNAYSNFLDESINFGYSNKEKYIKLLGEKFILDKD